jgi:galactokinase
VTPQSTPADVRAFLETLHRRAAHPAREVRGLLAPGEVFVARAPGRLDVMGGIADYSGSLVLQWPIREATMVALQRCSEPLLRIASLAGDGTVRTCEVPFSALGLERGSAPYGQARAWFAADPERHWAAYVAGAWPVLARERGVRFEGGARVLIRSEVPEGKGLSSSAALEAAAMRALVASLDLDLGGRDMALLCQAVENLVVGAPCGVMDQMAAICGEQGRLMALLCQPAEFLGTIAVPGRLAVWGIDSGIRHAVSGADYGSVRVGAFMGYRILADAVGLPVRPANRPGLVVVEDDRWHGYLANVSPAEFERLADGLPHRMDGRPFLDRYAGTTDPVTAVQPTQTYAVRVPTGHPVFEHARVVEWRDRLADQERAGAAGDATLGEALGRRMYESHASYSACGLGSDGTDELVARARQAGVRRGVYGAKITGGGSGGTVALLTRSDAGDVVEEIAARYAACTGRTAAVFSGSSPGAMASGVIRTMLE